MTNRTCAVDGCEKSHYGQSWCQLHYTRWRRHGTTTAPRKEPAAKALCSVDGCNKQTQAKSLCPMHYQRVRIYGSLESPMPTVTERFLAKVQKTESCWLWTASTDGKGYGQMRLTSNGAERLVQAHRLSYELFVGEIPEDMVIDHICHVVNCVNPAHLRTAFHKENMEHRSGAASHSKTGVRGVSPRRGGYRGTVKHNHQQFYVGHFSTIAEAEAAVIAKRNEIFTHNDLDRQ